MTVKFTSHYETLKVSRDAPAEVIRAAYRALAHVYHPDKQASPEDQGEMARLNAAWEVLGNCESRSAYDKWLAAKESGMPTIANSISLGRTGLGAYFSSEEFVENRARSVAIAARVARATNSPRPGAQHGDAGTLAKSVERNQSANLVRGIPGAVRIALIPIFVAAAWILGVGASVLWTKLQSNSTSRQSPENQAVIGLGSATARTEQPSTNAVGQTSAPPKSGGISGEAVPARSAAPPNSLKFDDWIKQSAKQSVIPSDDPDFREQSGPIGRQRALGGLSRFTIDNSSGRGDVVVRLYKNGDLPAVRSVIVKRGDSYTVNSISPGEYVMRYRNIGSKETFEANKKFHLEELEAPEGIRFSTITVTMYSVSNGNLTNRIVDSELF